MDKAEADYVTTHQIPSLSVQRLREHPSSLSEVLHVTAMPLLHCVSMCSIPRNFHMLVFTLVVV